MCILFKFADLALNLTALFPLVLLITWSFGHADPFDTFRDCAECPDMIELPLGEFVMGAPEDEFRRGLVWRDGTFFPATSEHPFTKTDEGPQHRVTVDSPFALGRNEVTHGEWMACVDDGGCGGYRGRDFMYNQNGKVIPEVPFNKTHPMLFVSYEDILLYIGWLNDATGTDAYRLPTEAEGGYAARAGTVTRFAQGDNVSDQQVNFSGKMTRAFMADDRTDLVTRGLPVRVEELEAANAWGLRHMSGNVNEVTRSCYSEKLPGWQTTSRWFDEGQVEICRRVNRGGSYVAAIDNSRVAWRGQLVKMIDLTSKVFIF